MSKLTEYVDAETGQPCAVARMSIPMLSSFLNGYVLLPKTSVYQGVHYDHVPERWHDAAYRGLTYAGDLLRDGRWWVGYDTYEHDKEPKDEAFIRTVNRRLSAAVQCDLEEP